MNLLEQVQLLQAITHLLLSVCDELQGIVFEKAFLFRDDHSRVLIIETVKQQRHFTLQVKFLGGFLALGLVAELHVQRLLVVDFGHVFDAGREDAHQTFLLN